MTLRERIADWISGGALSRAQDRLDRIAACETAGANATVRKMARIAREGLE